MTARQKWAIQCNNCNKECPVPGQNTIEEARLQANTQHYWFTFMVDNGYGKKYREDVCPDCQKLPIYREYLS